MTDPASSPSPNVTSTDDRARFRRTLVKVMAVQIVTLFILWWLQQTFTP